MKNTRKLADTDLCVMCGMCLPLCPTYQLHQTETESPRGRIALMQAIDQKRITADAKALQHIDHCLGCLNCESICPSQVPYEKLIDEFRNQYSQSIKKPFLSRLILKQAATADGLGKLTSFASKPLIKQLINMTRSLTDWPQIPQHSMTAPFKSIYKASGQRRGRVSLFTGCSGKSSDYNTIKDTSFILNQLGFDVHIPEQEICCGTLHQHNGQLDTARKLHQDNQLALHSLQVDAILFFSPACGASLMSSNGLNIVDARSFIVQALQTQPLNFAPSMQPVALHESCSQQNRLKLKNVNTDLLNYVPDIKINTSSQPSLCCGAGGIQSINYPLQARALRDEKLKSFDFTQTNILISDNIGCNLHLNSAASGYNPNIEIMHPISYLARQLEPDIES
jgi:glycolate dehydrogenase iron-sulfur subunit